MLATLLEDPSNVLLEVGPGRTLCSAALSSAEPERRQDVIPSMRSRNDDTDDQAEWLLGLGRLWVSGVAIDWTRLARGELRQRVALPSYPFRRESFWLSPEKRTAESGGLERGGPASWLYVPSWTRSSPLVPREISGSANALVFASADDGGLSAALIEELGARGIRARVVWRGERFARRSDGSLELAAGARGCAGGCLSLLLRPPRRSGAGRRAGSGLL
jgi:acyl transferase domain-containing protein